MRHYQLRVHASLDDPSDLGPGYQALLPDWAPSEVLARDGAGHATKVLGRCNWTHTVLYTTGGRTGRHDSMPAADWQVQIVRPSDSAPPPVMSGGSHLLYFTEPPSMYDFNRAANYTGFVANTREATIWRPLVPPESIHQVHAHGVGMCVLACACAAGPTETHLPSGPMDGLYPATCSP